MVDVIHLEFRHEEPSPDRAQNCEAHPDISKLGTQDVHQVGSGEYNYEADNDVDCGLRLG